MLDRATITAERIAMEQQLLNDPNVDPRYLKVLKLRELESLYAAEEDRPAVRVAHAVERPPFVPPAAPETPLPPWPSTGASHSRGTGKINRPMRPERLAIIEHAANLIRGKREPTRTAEIFDMLDEGVRQLIRGNDARANLSAMLHHSPLFVSHSRAGWTLATQAVDPAYAAVADLVDVAQDVERQREGFTFTP